MRQPGGEQYHDDDDDYDDDEDGIMTADGRRRRRWQKVYTGEREREGAGVRARVRGLARASAGRR